MTHKHPTVLALTILLGLPAITSAETAADVIDRMIEAETANYAGITSIFQRTRTLGHMAPEYFEKDGDLMRPVPLSELLERQQPNEFSRASPEDLENASEVLRQQSGAADAALQQEIAKSGLGSGAMGEIISMASNPEKPWLTGSPGGMMNLYATMLDASAKAKRDMAAEKVIFPSEAKANRQTLIDLKSQTRIIGHQKVDGRDAIELGADDLNVVQKSSDGDFTMESIRILVDAERYLPIRFKIDGTLVQGSESRPMTIERIDSQFDGGENCRNLLKPHHSVMRLGGAMTPEQQAELAEAEVQLAEFDQQLASMPPAQQEMMKQMIGPQLEMIRNMAKTGGIEIPSAIVELRCDRPPTAEELATKLF